MQRHAQTSLLSGLVLAAWIGTSVAAQEGPTSLDDPGRELAILRLDALRDYVSAFNAKDHTHFGQTISNESAADWMADNVPLFECPDKDLEEIYHFRWWTYRKHIKKTPDGFVITEFLPKVGWSGKHNTISCPAGHHFREGRWIRDGRYLDDYAVFWFRKGGDPRRYSFWAADAVYHHALALGDFSRAVDLLPDLVANYEAWEESRLEPDGLFWQIDDRDGMEVSIGGSGHRGQGKRATINSYMYGDARAIAAIAERADEPEIAEAYRNKADRLKRLVLDKLWDDEAKFFKVLPRGEQAERVDVRELHGFTPWYFHLPDTGQGYELAWKQLIDPKGFHAPFGPTVAEQRHERFAVSYTGHECQWNGPSWPFATAVTLTAMANVLNDYPQQTVSSADYFEILEVYTKSHRLKLDDGTVVPWIDENLNPYTGDWIARSRLKTWENGTWSQGKGGVERGKDYNHSTYCDLIITGLVGLRPRPDEMVEVQPLLPEGTWSYFCLDGVPYHGRSLTILFDETGEKYGRGSGLRILVDGQEIAASKTLTRLTAPLPGRGDEPPARGLVDVTHDRVRLTDGFWAQRQRTHHEVTIPHALDSLEADGHVTNFDRAAGVSDLPIQGHHAFDSDLHKALEGALCSLQHREDAELEARVEKILDRIVTAQADDGFLISYFLAQNQEKRWEDLRLEHQLYNAGHFFEMAVEHERLTGNDRVLNAARRFADHIDGTFGPGQRYDVGGHEEVELALIKLYRATGEKRYLELCQRVASWPTRRSTPAVARSR